jgi:hypothetical protein
MVKCRKNVLSAEDVVRLRDGLERAPEVKMVYPRPSELRRKSMGGGGVGGAATKRVRMAMEE